MSSSRSPHASCEARATRTSSGPHLHINQIPAFPQVRLAKPWTPPACWRSRRLSSTWTTICYPRLWVRGAT